MKSLVNVSSDALHTGIRELRGKESAVIAEIVLHLNEIDKRAIYRDAGYSSLFKYCCEALGYSEGSAWRRVQAARALNQSPEIYEKIRDGKISLCALSEVSKVLSPKNASEILKKTEGITKSQAQCIAVEFGAPEKPRREVIRARKVALPPAKSNMDEIVVEAPVDERFSFSFEGRQEMRDLYTEAKELLGRYTMAEIFEEALRELVDRRKTLKRTTKTYPSKLTRYIPKATRIAVMRRDGGQCTFVSDEGKRCTERCGLQIDHRQPFAKGGTREIENLRLLCPAHNQLYAEKCFGKQFMKLKQAEGSIPHSPSVFANGHEGK